MTYPLSTHHRTDQASAVDAVEVAALLTFNRELAREVRLSGSEEELRAFQYAKSKLDEWGLSTELTFDEAYISLPGKVDFQAGDEAIQAITHSMAASVEGLEAGLVAAGEIGFTPGNAVLLDGLASWQTVRQWEQAGASAVVFVNSGEHVHEMIVSSVWGNPSPEDAAASLSLPVISVNKETGTRLRHLIAGAGGELPIRLSAKVDTGWRSIPTLTAELRGQEEPERFVLFSGHIDSWHYGAMDNASANAVMLEVARVLAKQGMPPRRTLRLAFWSGHSHGRYAGSALYADRHYEELNEHGVLHVNIDSVGGQGATLLTAANIMAETTALASEAIREITDEHEFAGRPFGRAGDQSFWGAGLPSAFMGLSYQPDGWFGWWWHTTEDTLDKIDPANLERDARIYVATIHRAIHAPILPIDHRESVWAIRRRLQEYEQLAGERLDLRVLLTRAEQLQSATDRLYQAVAKPEPPIEIANRVLHQLSTFIVPIGYVKGGRFEPDPALPQPFVPALAEIEQLAVAEPGSDAFYRLRTLLVRRVNRLANELKHAIAVVEEGLEQLAR